MARIVVTSSGSSGDVNPVIALALGLRTRGHDVVLVLEDRLCAGMEQLGFAAHPMSGNLDAFFRQHLGTIVRARFPETAATGTRLYVRDYIKPHFRSQVQEILHASRDADLVVAPWIHHAAAAAAEVGDLPWVTLAYSPLIVASAHVMAYPPFRRLPPRLHVPANRFTWALGRAMFGSILNVPINAARAEFGLPARKHLATVGSLSPHLSALAMSPSLVQPMPDLPPEVRVTGFMYWDTPLGWECDRELESFLSDDRPVVALYFGSMAGSPLGPLYRTSVEAVLRLGARALVIGGTAASLGVREHDDILALPFAPFSEVFRRCAVVVHHGGVGTAARALQAGVPMLVIPWGYDQFNTAMMMVDAGVARTVTARRCSVRSVTHALRPLLADSGYRASATEMARAISREDGVQHLVQSIEELLGQ